MDNNKRIQELENRLSAAIEDIPHVGNKCYYLDWSKGHCTKDRGICCYRVHTFCPSWRWRGDK